MCCARRCPTPPSTSAAGAWGLPQDGGVELAFEDGSRAQSDVLVGADGIRSTFRDTVVPPSPPASPVSAATAVSSRSSVPRPWQGDPW